MPDITLKSERIEPVKAALSEATLPVRQRLPNTRESVTHKFNIGGYEGYLTVGLFEDGRPGELFVKMAKQGSTMAGLMDAIGVLTSLTLQYGVPVDTLARKFQYMRFEPSGTTHNPDLGDAASVVDYVFRWLGVRFSKEYRDEHAMRHATLQTDRNAEAEAVSKNF
jgi:ribonucleoside-diphosphate reductase alpha chain